MKKFRTYNQVDHRTGSQLLEQVVEQRARLADRLSRVGTVVAIVSGKGGVGKSAVTANLAVTLAGRGRRVGVLDADLNGPSVARMLGVLGKELGDAEGGVVPAKGIANVRVISMDLLQGGANTPLRWKEPGSDSFLWQSSIEVTALREFLADVEWDGSDYLLIDVPPGTDKIRRLLELVPDLPVALIVTTPSEIARSVVARSIRLAGDANVPTLALVSNMVGYICPECDTLHPLFPGNGDERLAAETGLPIWARIPFDPRLGEATDSGGSYLLDYPDGQPAKAFVALADQLEALNSDPAPEVSP